MPQRSVGVDTASTGALDWDGNSVDVPVTLYIEIKTSELSSESVANSSNFLNVFNYNSYILHF